MPFLPGASQPDVENYICNRNKLKWQNNNGKIIMVDSNVKVVKYKTKEKVVYIKVMRLK